MVVGGKMRLSVRLVVVNVVIISAILSGYTKIIAQQNNPDSTVMIGTVETLTNLDPADASDVFTWEILTHLYSGLTRQIPGTLRYELDLAATHTVSHDELTHTFTIKPHAAFSDGTPITAQTFADSINRVLSLNGQGVIAVKPYIKTVAADGNSLLFNLVTPVPYLDQLVALPPYFALHPSDFKPDTFNRTPDQLIGSGVYSLTGFQYKKSITLTANLKWKGTPPASSTIVLREYAAPADLRRALLSHEVDIAWRGLPYDEAEIVLQTQGIKAYSQAGLRTFYLVMSQTKKPYNDPAVRQNLLLLLERDYLANTTLRGTAAPLYTLLPPELADEKAPRFPKSDIAKAKEQLRVAGYSKYNTLDTEMQTSRQLYGDLIIRAIQQISADEVRSETYRLSPQDTELVTFLDQIERQNFRLILIGWTPLVPHPDAYLRPLLGSKGQLALGAEFTDPKIDKLLDQAALLSDLSQQNTLYDQVQTLGLQAAVAVPLWQEKQSLQAWSNISGVSIEPNYILHYDQLVRH
jgi:peptide/nickel transport system substrate-binding protein